MNIKLFTTVYDWHYSRYYSIPSHANVLFINSISSLSLSSTQVWFQNRRMKDKRQRIAIAWPYAAIYSDPTMAASILQACANSVGMAPYGAYAHPMIPQIPQVMPPQMHASAATNAHFSYGAAAAYHRYGPYPIPPPQSQRTPQVSSQLPSQYANSQHATSYGPLSIPKPQCTPPHDLLQSPSSQNSLSPGSDKEINHNSSSKFDLSSSSNDNSPVKSLASPTQGLLMTAPAQPSPQQTTVILPEKPKLFKPYKSEA